MDFRGETKFLFQMALASPWQKYQLFVARYFTRTEWKPNQADREWIRLPKQLGFLYYVIRPIRLCYRIGVEQLKLIHSISGRLRP